MAEFTFEQAEAKAAQVSQMTEKLGKFMDELMEGMPYMPTMKLAALNAALREQIAPLAQKYVDLEKKLFAGVEQHPDRERLKKMGLTHDERKLFLTEEENNEYEETARALHFVVKESRRYETLGSLCKMLVSGTTRFTKPDGTPVPVR